MLGKQPLDHFGFDEIGGKGDFDQLAATTSTAAFVVLARADATVA